MMQMNTLSYASFPDKPMYIVQDPDFLVLQIMGGDDATTDA